MSGFQTHAAGLIVAALGMLCAAPAAAQTVFFDDFDGNDLKPHWRVPPPEHWDYEVRDSRLFINDLFWPSDPNFTNSAVISADLPMHLGDFNLHTRMGWEDFISGWTMEIRIWDVGTRLIAGMGGLTGGLFIQTSLSSPQRYSPAPPARLSDYVIRRRGTDVEFLLNEVLVTSLPDRGNPAASIQFVFTQPYPPPTVRTPASVDFIRVVPAPGTAVVGLVWCGLLCSKGRKR